MFPKSFSFQQILSKLSVLVARAHTYVGAILNFSNFQKIFGDGSTSVTLFLKLSVHNQLFKVTKQIRLFALQNVRLSPYGINEDKDEVLLQLLCGHECSICLWSTLLYKVFQLYPGKISENGHTAAHLLAPVRCLHISIRTNGNSGNVQYKKYQLIGCSYIPR